VSQLWITLNDTNVRYRRNNKTLYFNIVKRNICVKRTTLKKKKNDNLNKIQKIIRPCKTLIYVQSKQYILITETTKSYFLNTTILYIIILFVHTYWTDNLITNYFETYINVLFIRKCFDIISLIDFRITFSSEKLINKWIKILF